MPIECSCPLWTSAESCLGVVFPTRDRLGQGEDNGLGERGPRTEQGFSPEHTLSESRLGRGGAIVTLERGVRRSMVYDPWTKGNGRDGGLS
jgi:hypothetical protein